MKLRQLAALAMLFPAMSACVHTPPGTSVNIALAKKAELVRLPGALPKAAGLPVIEPELPGNSIAERAGEAFSRGRFCMDAGKDAEAVAAFEEAVKIDSGCTDAWQHLAIIYAKLGQDKQALEAFHRAKKLAQH